MRTKNLPGIPISNSMYSLPQRPDKRERKHRGLAVMGIISTYYFTKPYCKEPHLVFISESGMYGLLLEAHW